MKYYFRVIFFIYVLAIFFLSIYPSPEEIIKVQLSDKIEHAVAFLIYSVLFFFSFNKGSIFYVFWTGLFFGVFIEMAQIFSPNRVPSFLDILADIVGLFVGILVIYVILYKKNKWGLLPPYKD